MFSYTCPGCDEVLKSSAKAPIGKKIRCKSCGTAFVAEPADDVIKLKDEPPTPAAKPAPVPVIDDDDADINPYGVSKDEDTEEQIEAKKKVKFGALDDKGKRSARGPAMSLLVMPSNLLIGEGALTVLGGLILTIWSFWPLIFTEVAASDDEIFEQLPWILFGIIVFVWGALICLGASRMQNLESYTWALTGAVLGILPLLAGVMALAMLRNPKVIAGFAEVEGAVDEDEEGGDDDEDDDD